MNELIDRIALVLGDYFYGSTNITSGSVLEATRQVVKLFEPVPWCDEHDLQLDQWALDNGVGVHGMIRMKGPCRLEEPARHYVIGAE